MADLHKRTKTPWIKFQRFSDEEITTLLYKGDVHAKCKSATDAILGLMGFYYSFLLSYPYQANGALLFVQDRVLKDNAHTADQKPLRKAVKAMDEFKKLSEEKNLFD